jgi:hypothetical protein
MRSLSAACSLSSSRGGRAFPSRRSALPGRTMPCFGWARTWSCGCPASSGPPDRWRRSTGGCRGLPRSCRLPSPSRSRRGCPPRTTRGRGPSTGGSKERRRPWRASPIGARPRLGWLGSSPPCTRSTPPAGRSLGSTTSFRGEPLSRRDAEPAGPTGRLSAVIDFGCLGVGDPACDVMVAWTYLSAETRGAFRAALPVDDATWARGRGWALSFGLIALPYYESTNPVLAGIARYAIDEVLADHERN